MFFTLVLVLFFNGLVQYISVQFIPDRAVSSLSWKTFSMRCFCTDNVAATESLLETFQLFFTFRLEPLTKNWIVKFSLSPFDCFFLQSTMSDSNEDSKKPASNLGRRNDESGTVGVPIGVPTGSTGANVPPEVQLLLSTLASNPALLSGLSGLSALLSNPPALGVGPTSDDSDDALASEARPVETSVEDNKVANAVAVAVEVASTAAVAVEVTSTANEKDNDGLLDAESMERVDVIYNGKYIVPMIFSSSLGRIKKTDVEHLHGHHLFGHKGNKSVIGLFAEVLFLLCRAFYELEGEAFFEVFPQTLTKDCHKYQYNRRHLEKNLKFINDKAAGCCMDITFGLQEYDNDKNDNWRSTCESVSALMWRVSFLFLFRSRCFSWN